jgi:membrane protease YdiL (CAAX protease family)
MPGPDELPPPRRRGRPVLAWLIVLATVGFVLWRHSQASPVLGNAEQGMLLRFQARTLVGTANFLPGSPSTKVYKQAQDAFGGGSYGQRLRFAVLAGELAGPEEALEQLRQSRKERTEGRVKADPKDVEVERLLGRLYAGYVKGVSRGPVLPEAEQQVVRERLGWFGELALAPPGGPDAAARERALRPARQALVAYLALLGLGLVGLLTGGGLLLVLGALWLAGRLSSGLGPGSGNGGAYAETFALYLVFYMALGFAFRSVPRDLRLLANALAMFLSLGVLAWPVRRGVPWRQVRADVGWHGERRPGLGLLFGLGTYLGALPLAAVGLVIALALVALRRHYGWGPAPFSPGEEPTHPVVGEVVRGGGWVWLQLFLVASVAAPVVEETMFRGLLYRHLREATGSFAPALSVLVSALFSSFVFAVIHPQGWLAVPVLTALATAFALAREWRGSLVPSMIAHGLNNTAVTLVLFLVSH